MSGEYELAIPKLGAISPERCGGGASLRPRDLIGTRLLPLPGQYVGLRLGKYATVRIPLIACSAWVCLPLERNGARSEAVAPSF